MNAKLHKPQRYWNPPVVKSWHPRKAGMPDSPGTQSEHPHTDCTEHDTPANLRQQKSINDAQG
jgi:hypothetical protein